MNSKARRQKSREARAEEKKTQGREVDAKARKDKRGASYADHRLHIETSLRRHQRLPPTSEQLLMHEQRALTSLFMYYHRCGCDNIAPAEEFAELE